MRTLIRRFLVARLVLSIAFGREKEPYNVTRNVIAVEGVGVFLAHRWLSLALLIEK